MRRLTLIALLLAAGCATGCMPLPIFDQNAYEMVPDTGHGAILRKETTHKELVLAGPEGSDVINSNPNYTFWFVDPAGKEKRIPFLHWDGRNHFMYALPGGKVFVDVSTHYERSRNSATIKLFSPDRLYDRQKITYDYIVAGSFESTSTGSLLYMDGGFPREIVFVDHKIKLIPRGGATESDRLDGMAPVK